MTCNQRITRPRTQVNTVPYFGNFVNELFNTAVGDVIQKSEHRFFTNPATNVITFDDRYELEVALPGFSKNDIEIEVDNDVLKISSKEISKDDAPKLNYRLREFNYAGFKKSFKLPESADGQKVKANFNQGLLLITIPKKEEAIPQPSRKIDIK